METIDVTNLEQCKLFAESMGDAIRQNWDADRQSVVVALVGTLGAGKTQFVRFFAEHLGVDSEDITSPTFVLIQSYCSVPKIHHIDAYRINDEDEFFELGIDELFDQPCIIFIEWADRFSELLPENRIEVTLSIENENRTARVEFIGDVHQVIGESLRS